MQFKDILYNVEGDYAYVTIDRPSVLNAFTPVTLQELKSALDMAEKDKNVGVIVLSGSGDRAFCAGGRLQIFGALNLVMRRMRMHSTPNFRSRKKIVPAKKT